MHGHPVQTGYITLNLGVALFWTWNNPRYSKRIVNILYLFDLFCSKFEFILLLLLQKSCLFRDPGIMYVPLLTYYSEWAFTSIVWSIQSVPLSLSPLWGTFLLVVVQIAKCICSNYKMYLFKLQYVFSQLSGRSN